MKWLVAWVLAGTTVAAAAPEVLPLKPSPAKRKSANAKYWVEAIAQFAEAMMLDRAGDLERAASKYRAILDENQANIAYNLADIKRRIEHYPQAVELYKKYLELAPDAPDRKEVERLIELIETRPPVVVIDGEDFDAIVLVDGKLIGPSPVQVLPTTGRHTTDRIGPKTYRHESFSAFVAQTQHVALRYKEAEGNVIFSASPTLHLKGTWEDDGTKFELPGRFDLPPGHYETFVKSSKASCNKIAFDVAKGDDLTYVYIDVKPTETKEFCVPLTAKVQKLRVPK